LVVSASGDVGIGVTPSAWDTVFKAAEIGAAGTGIAGASGQPVVFSNAYYNGGWKYAATGAASNYDQASGAHRFFTAASGSANGAITFTQAMTLDASGNLGVGTTSPLFGVGSGIEIQRTAASATLRLERDDGGGSSICELRADSAAITLESRDAVPLIFGTGQTERARITSGGDLLVGFTSGGSNSTSLVKANAYNCKPGLGNNLGANTFNIQWTGGGNAELWIDSSNIGNIAFSSDYRVKKNIQTQSNNAIERILRLRPVTYELADYGDLFKSDAVSREGFIAHEVQEVIPSGAEGQKDEEHRIQNLRVDAILSVVVKAIQELKAEIDQLKGT
jgi:hypothetical protein